MNELVERLRKLLEQATPVKDWRAIWYELHLTPGNAYPKLIAALCEASERLSQPQPTEVVEAAARAIYESHFIDKWPPKHWAEAEKYRDGARAALAALPQPSPAIEQPIDVGKLREAVTGLFAGGFVEAGLSGEPSQWKQEFETRTTAIRAALHATTPVLPDPGKLEAKFKMGDQVAKTNGYRFDSEIRSVFTKKCGAIRIVAENSDGLLHIFNEDQLALQPPRTSEPTPDPGKLITELDDLIENHRRIPSDRAREAMRQARAVIVGRMG